jgi:hypothetical protein
MEAKPFIIVRASKPISVSKVHKALKKFLHSHAHPSTALSTTGTIAALPDDVTNKLVTVLAELEELKGTTDDSEPIVSVKSSGADADAMVDSSGKKKRKKDRESEGGLEKKKNRKDKHRDSVESSTASATPVAVVASAKKDVDKLNSMKKAAKKA